MNFDFAENPTGNIIRSVIERLKPLNAPEKQLIRDKLLPIISGMSRVIKPSFQRSASLIPKTGLERLHLNDAKRLVVENIAAAIAEEIRSDSGTLENPQTLATKLDEIAEGFSQFSEAEIHAIVRKNFEMARTNLSGEMSAVLSNFAKLVKEAPANDNFELGNLPAPIGKFTQQIADERRKKSGTGGSMGSSIG